MRVAQYYDTVVEDRETGSALRYIVIPARSFKNTATLRDRKMLAQRLRFEVIQQLSASDLPRALLATLLEDRTEIAFTTFQWKFNRPAEIAPSKTDELRLAFAEYAAYEKLIPFEESPLSPEALASVALRGSGAAAGAMAAYVAFGNTPLVFVAVPAGMILCGAAAGLAKALHDGLEQQVRKLMGLPNVVTKKKNATKALRPRKNPKSRKRGSSSRETVEQRLRKPEPASPSDEDSVRKRFKKVDLN